MGARAAQVDFLGAAGTVTGSRFLVTGQRGRVLVDCGLYQGLRDLRRRNWEPFPVDPQSIDAVVVTHAHLDHSGYLPALVARGYSGPIFTTPGTADLLPLVLRDSAHLQVEDAEHARKHGYSKHDPPLPLYMLDDVERALALVRRIELGHAGDVAPGFAVEMRRAGHILGSASVVLTVDDGPRILISGDLGRDSHPLLLPPEPPPAVDAVLVESTYGDRAHGSREDPAFMAAINRTVHRGGSVVIPAFAVDRTEVVLMELRRLRAAGRIPAVPIYVDSPMALGALSVYRDAVRGHAPDVRPDLADDPNLFDPGDVHEARTVAESRALNQPAYPCIIVSASGMATGGRVLHHLAALLPDPRACVVLAGYQALGTRGRDLVDGARAIKLHGGYVPVRAEVVDVPMFSVHADGDEILRWLGRCPAAPATCFVVHGEPRPADAVARRIREELGWNAVVPRRGERVLVARAQQ